MDLIDRQAAIDALIRKSQPVDNGDGTMTITMMTNRVIKETLEQLPSVQPEIIRCKDCVNHVDDRCLVANHHTGDIEYCMEVFGAKRRGEQDGNQH